MADTVTISELAKLCHRSVRTLQGWRQKGRITPVSPMLPNVFGAETLAALGLTAPPRTETIAERRKRAARALFGKAK